MDLEFVEVVALNLILPGRGISLNVASRGG